MKYRMFFLVFISILLVGCSKDNNSNTENNHTESRDTETTASKPMTPNNCYGYGVGMNIDRCVNVNGNIEYHSNVIPFEYVGEEVRYHCNSNFRYKYENGYEHESIDCLVMLFFNGQYIPFSVNNSEKMFTHKLKAINKLDDSDGTCYVDFEFSFYPYGLECGNTENFEIIVIPLQPLNISEEGEKINLLPTNVAASQKECPLLGFFLSPQVHPPNSLPTM